MKKGMLLTGMLYMMTTQWCSSFYKNQGAASKWNHSGEDSSKCYLMRRFSTQKEDLKEVDCPKVTEFKYSNNSIRHNHNLSERFSDICSRKNSFYYWKWPINQIQQNVYKLTQAACSSTATVAQSVFAPTDNSSTDDDGTNQWYVDK